MQEITLILPEHVILKRRCLLINSNISYLSEFCSCEEGWGTSIDKLGYGRSFSVAAKADLVSRYEGANTHIQRFNKQ